MQDAPRPARQSSLSSSREPRVPPRHVLETIEGRVLDPGTALTIKGVKPRSTVYVGPRLLVSRGPQDEESITALEEVAATLGWDITVSKAQTVRRGPREDVVDTNGARSSATPKATSSSAEETGVLRLDLSVRDKEATIAPDGWVLLQNARAPRRPTSRASSTSVSTTS